MRTFPSEAGRDRRTYRPGTVRAALSYPRFRIFFVANSLSSVGTWMQNFTLPAYVDHRTGSASLVGLLVFTQLGPLLLLSLPAGVLADRFDRRRLVASMQAVMMAASIAIAVLIIAEAPLWTLFAAQFAVGVANALNAPALSASLPMMVDRQDVPGAVSVNSAMLNGSRVAGPALAALLATIGVGTAQLFLINGATYLFLIVPVLVLGLPSARADHPERGWRRLTTGINIARRRKVLARVLWSMTLFSLVCLPFIGLFPSVARLNLGIEPTSATYKMLYAVWASGAFIGSLAVGSWLAAFDKRRVIPYGFAAFGVTLGAFALMRSPGPAFFVCFLLGFAYFMTATCMITVIQQNVTDAERAPVMPLWFMSFGGTVPMGNLIAGPIIDRVGARPVLAAGALFAIFLAWWTDLSRLGPEAFLPE